MEINPKEIYQSLNGSKPGDLSHDMLVYRPEVELRSEEVHEILSKRPAGIIRYGLSILGLTVATGLFASWFIKYPEVLKSSVMITTQQPPIKVIPKASGRLQRLLVKPNQPVKQGDFLAEIENTTRLENMPVLQALSNQLKSYLESPFAKVTFPSNTLTFGDLQVEYNTLVKNYDEAERLMGDAIYQQRKKLLQQQIEDYKKLVTINERQVEINAEEFKNTEIKYAADKKLYQDRVYGKLEFLNFENTYLQKKKDKENYSKTLIENSLVLSERQKQLIELDFEYLQKTRMFRDNIRQSVQNIDNLLLNWQQNYVITSPSGGSLSFLKTLTENQAIRSGDTLFVIIPQNQPVIALAMVSAQNFGKVKVGQQAIIKLINYPFEEYGSVSAIIQEIEPASSGGLYRVKMSLTNGLITNYKKTLPFKNEMQGSLEIITEDLRLLERVFYGLRKMLNQS
jgi:multidrug resistance efflux pump